MRILFAGAQNTRHQDNLFKMDVKNVLMSFYYLRTMKEEKITRILSRLKEQGAFCMLDSGAHTFFSFHDLSSFHRKHVNATGETKTKGKGYIPPDDFVLQYLDFCKKYRDYFDVIVELDINTIVGLEKVESWRALFASEGIQVMPVYHLSYEDHFNATSSDKARIECRMHEFGKMCDEYPYVGIEGGWDKRDYLPMLQMAQQKRVKVHGFAMTNVKVFRHLPFYSVDSTTWLAGEQYGRTFVFKGGIIKTYDAKHKKSLRAKYEQLCNDLGIDYQAFLADNGDAVTQFNIHQWNLFQQHMDIVTRNDPVKVASGEALEIEKKSAPMVRGTSPEHNFGRWCDTCYVATQCPFFEAGHECSVNFPKPTVNESGVPDVKQMLSTLLMQSYERLQFAMGAERLKGGLLDPDVSKELQNFIQICEKVKDITSDRTTLTISAEGAKGVGVIGEMFGGFMKNRKRTLDGEVIDAEPIPRK